MDTIVVYSAKHSNRLKYILDWLLKERLQLDYTIVRDEKETAAHPFIISYGTPLPNAISIPDAGLLWETGVHKLAPPVGKWDELPVLFATSSSNCSLPFDLFSAAFFLLSRYEEYDHSHADKHGRYPAANSILYKQGWLQRPILDEWVHAFRKRLQASSSASLPVPHFIFQPTYDIDIAYSHIHKGASRIIGAYIRALIKGDVRQINERTQVLKKKQKDPYDSFRWLRQLHKQYDYKPIYFVLAAAKTTAFDKNIHPKHPAMMRVIKNIAKEGSIGIHPSYYSEQKNTMPAEKQMLDQVSGKLAIISRQHYIRIRIPETYRMLISNGITADYSMGYGAYLGFRAGSGAPFYWYDIEKESVTGLRVHPFCFMDTTAHFEAKLSPADAFSRLHAMSALLEKTGSTLITVFHNFSLGTAGEWKGWRQAYENFLQEKTTLHKDQVLFH